MRFASSLLKEHNSVLKTVFTSFYVTFFLLRNYNNVLLKNVFCIKSPQKIQLAVENCVLLHFVKKLPCSKLYRYLAKKCVLHQISSKNTTRCWKLCSTSFCVQNFLLPNYKDILLKNAFCIKSAQRIQLAAENFVSLNLKLKSSFCEISRIFS